MKSNEEFFLRTNGLSLENNRRILDISSVSEHLFSGIEKDSIYPKVRSEKNKGNKRL